MGLKEEKISQIGKMIIENARNELYVSLRYLDLAIFALKPEADNRAELLGTDGSCLYYSSEKLIEEFNKNSRQINRANLHSIFHCLFRHLWSGLKYEGEDITYWDIACDIAVEHIIDNLDVSAVNPIVSRYRTYVYKRLSLEMEIFTAEGIFKALKEWDFSDSDFKIMYKAFKTDDHGFWARPKAQGKNPPPAAADGGENSEGSENPKPPEVIANAEKLGEKWKDLSERTALEAQSIEKAAGDGDETLIESLKAANRRRYDYREFLKRFAVYGEEAKPDPDSFDVAFYTYGMNLYGDMPIIEPLEYREVKKVSDFIIAIDTSASCSGEAAKSFLSLTFDILKLRDSFFNRVKIHIIQCDNKVRKDTVVETREDLTRVLEGFELVGFGGTDFRPVFEYVETIRKDLNNLKGLIYFTDGEGVFPEKPPAYDTAFVFLKEHYYDAKVPNWAVKLIIGQEDLENEHYRS